MRSGQGGVVHAILQLPCGMHHRWLTVGEAERMVERGECCRARVPGKKSIGKTRPIYRMIPQVAPSDSAATTAALTPFDLLASLGLAGTRDQRMASSYKIAVYDDIH